MRQFFRKKLSFDRYLRSRTLSTKKTRDRKKLASDYAFVIQIAHLPKVRKDCMWGDDIGVHALRECSFWKVGPLVYLSIPIYPSLVSYGGVQEDTVSSFTVTYEREKTVKILCSVLLTSKTSNLDEILCLCIVPQVSHGVNLLVAQLSLVFFHF